MRNKELDDMLKKHTLQMIELYFEEGHPWEDYQFAADFIKGAMMYFKGKREANKNDD